MSDIFWNRYFIVVKGYNFKDDYLHQYNKSSIILENNGKASRSKVQSTLLFGISLSTVGFIMVKFQ